MSTRKSIRVGIMPLKRVRDYTLAIAKGNNSRFSDFVITRLSKAAVIDAGDAARHERGEADEQWNRTVELKLIPHPRLKHKGAVEADYGMKLGGLLVKCRAAVAGYALRRWGVDCSHDHRLCDAEFQLALENHAVLGSIDSSALAPGYLFFGAPNDRPTAQPERDFWVPGFQGP